MATSDKSSQSLPFLCWILTLSCSSQCVADIHGSASVVSNYISRGYSKSRDQFAYRADIDYQHSSGFYVGTAAATVNFGDTGFSDPARYEIAPYFGWSFSLNDDWRLDSQMSRYLYDGHIFGLDADYNEYYAFLHYRDLLSLAASFSEDYYNRGHAAGFLEITGRYPITDFLEFSAGTGYTFTRRALDGDYLYWNAGMTAFYKFISLDLRYADASLFNVNNSHLEAVHSEFYPEALSATLLFSLTIGF